MQKKKVSLFQTALLLGSMRQAYVALLDVCAVQCVFCKSQIGASGLCQIVQRMVGKFNADVLRHVIGRGHYFEVLLPLCSLKPDLSIHVNLEIVIAAEICLGSNDLKTFC